GGEFVHARMIGDPQADLVAARAQGGAEIDEENLPAAAGSGTGADEENSHVVATVSQNSAARSGASSVARSRAAADCAARAAGSAASAVMASASASASPAGTTRPWMLSAISSPAPTASETMQGRPAPRAWLTTTPQPSWRLGSTKTSALANQSGRASGA